MFRMLGVYDMWGAWVEGSDIVGEMATNIMIKRTTAPKVPKGFLRANLQRGRTMPCR